MNVRCTTLLTDNANARQNAPKDIRKNIRRSYSRFIASRCALSRRGTLFARLFFLCSSLLWWLAAGSLCAQLQLREPVVWRIGVFGQYGANIHQATLDETAGFLTALPSAFTGGVGYGFALGALFEKPLSHTFSLSGRAAYSQLDGVMNSLSEAAFGGMGDIVLAELESRLSASISSFAVYPLAAWHPTPNLSLYAGVRLGVSWGSFSQGMSIVNDPTGQITFPANNQTSLVLTANAPIPQMATPTLALTAGVGYAFALNANETLFLAPEIWYAHHLTPVIGELPENQDWRIHSLRGGVSFRYSPEAARRYLPPAIVRTAETERLAVNITPVAVDSSGVESPLLRLRIEETLSRQTHPLLPFVFFDKNSDVLPARYIRLLPGEAAAFSERRLAQWGTLEMYYHVLNIIGKRLKDNPAASVRLVGCVSEDEFSEDGSHKELAMRRAETAMMYLRDVWRIPMSRISAAASPAPKALPEEAADGESKAASAENRRVEIYSDEWEILKPLAFADTLLNANPPTIKFALSARAQSPIAKWRFKIEQGRSQIQSLGSLGEPPSETYWSPSRSHRVVPRTEEAIRCNFDFVEQGGEGGSATISIPVEQLTIAKKRRASLLNGGKEASKSIDIYRFIQFKPARSPNAATITPEHERTLAEIARTRIAGDAHVLVTGYLAANDLPKADALRLTRERAQAITNKLASFISPGNHIPSPIVSGRAGDASRYGNDLPEARMYSRAVEIRIESFLSETE